MHDFVPIALYSQYLIPFRSRHSLYIQWHDPISLRWRISTTRWWPARLCLGVMPIQWYLWRNRKCDLWSSRMPNSWRFRVWYAMIWLIWKSTQLRCSFLSVLLWTSNENSAQLSYIADKNKCFNSLGIFITKNAPQPRSHELTGRCINIPEPHNAAWDLLATLGLHYYSMHSLFMAKLSKLPK